MELGTIPDGPPPDSDARAEGKSWCLRCKTETAYGARTVEFLGNAVKASYFCLQCDGRIHPGALNQQMARRFRAEARRVRLAAGLTVGVMLLLPVLVLAVIGWAIWRIL